MLTAAACLASKHDVRILWDDPEPIKKEALRRFEIDLSPITFEKNIFNAQTSFLTRFFVSRGYDYIIVLSDGSIPFVGSKLILHFQTPIEWVRYSIKTWIKLLRTQAVVTNSFFTKSFIDKKLHVKSTVIYPPVSIHEKKEKKENIILNVGRYGIKNAGSSYKKQEVLIETFQHMVKKSLATWKLVLVVSGSEEELATLLEKKDALAKDHIEIIPNCTNDVLWVYYTKAKIYWHAAGFGEDLILHPDRAEHFGIATVEAMGAGAVPIVMNAGGQREIVADDRNGYLWNTKEELQQKTTAVIEDTKKWELLSTNAIKRAQDFNQERFCQEINQLIT